MCDLDWVCVALGVFVAFTPTSTRRALCAHPFALGITVGSLGLGVYALAHLLGAPHV
ncbi:hypothetical protein OG422_31185 (plasmid) [Streptomyces sp. NBC_01525]|uniref:hypothetical protein n=1 Tax=Streptomyces sp. NBC_01525 TaxID=2903893 RepID=UPI002F906D04